MKLRLFLLNFFYLGAMVFTFEAKAQFDALFDAKTISISIDGEKGDYLTIPQTSLPSPPPRFLLFIRKDNDNSEILGRGIIMAVQDGKFLIELDFETMIKRPRIGDFVVPMGPPKDFPKLPDLNLNGSTSTVVQPPEPEEKGWAQLDGSVSSKGTYESVGFFKTNEYKDIPNYNPSYLHFIWYVDFLWRYGIEYTSISGSFLTNDYNHNRFPSDLKETRMSLHYRYPKFFYDQLRLTLKLNTFSNTFTTQNKDYYLLSSLASGTGFGARFAWELKPPQWETESYQPFTLQQIFFQYDLYPSLKIEDQEIFRGRSSNGSQLSQQQITISVLAYLKWMYLFQRYVIEFTWGQTQSKLKFSGSTDLANGKPSIVKPDGTYQESSQYMMISFGLRMDDLVGRFFKPR